MYSVLYLAFISTIWCIFTTGNVHGITRSGGSNGSSGGSSTKYLRGHLLAAVSAHAANSASSSAGSACSAGVAGSAMTTTPSRPSTSKVRVLSILDKIRSSTQENYATNGGLNNGRNGMSSGSGQTIQTNNEALIDAISLVEDNGWVLIPQLINHRGQNISPCTLYWYWLVMWHCTAVTAQWSKWVSKPQNEWKIDRIEKKVLWYSLATIQNVFVPFLMSCI